MVERRGRNVTRSSVAGFAGAWLAGSKWSQERALIERPHSSESISTATLPIEPGGSRILRAAQSVGAISVIKN